MKIGIVISGNSFKSPYLTYYINFLDKQKIEYDIICWNRRMIDESGNLSYNVSQNEVKGYFNRFYSYLGYKKFVIDCLDKNKYDRIIISTIAIAVLLYPYLKKYYRKKYLFDIRDYSLILKFTPFILKKIIDDSSATVISSAGFLHWLPKSKKYFITHNFPLELTNENSKPLFKENFILQNKEFLEITTIGSLRDFEANKLMVDSFKNSNQFILNIIGTGPAYDPLKEYVIDNKISNVAFYGFYQKKDEGDLLKNSVFLNNFTNLDLNSRTLMTNRFYLSAVFKIPMIVREGTYQAELCKKYSLGCILNAERNFEYQLKTYMELFNRENFINGCDRFLNEVEIDLNKLDLFLLNFTSKS